MAAPSFVGLSHRSPVVRPCLPLPASSLTTTAFTIKRTVMGPMRAAMAGKRERRYPGTAVVCAMGDHDFSRRELAVPTAATLLSAALLRSGRARAAGNKAVAVDGADRLVGMTLLAENPDAAASFYQKVFGMMRLPSQSADEQVVAFGDPAAGNFTTIRFRAGSAAASGAGEDGLKYMGIVVPNAPAARAAALSKGAKPGGDGLCSGDHLEGCMLKGPDGVPIKLLKDSGLIKKGGDRLCRIALNVADVPTAVQFYSRNLHLPSLKKQQGVVDRLAEDRPPPSGRTLLGTKSGGAVELFPVLAVKRGQGALVSLSFASPNGSATDNNAQITDPDGRMIEVV